jgi:uncharacterized protein (DUF2461 family)
LLLVKTLAHNGRKDGDMLVYSVQNGRDTPFPGIAIEVGNSDDLSKARRDITLWVDQSHCEVSRVQKYTLIVPGEDRYHMQG